MRQRGGFVRGVPAGFTLIELLAATAVFLILLLLTVQIVSATLSATKSESARRDVYNSLRVADTQLRQDFLARALPKGGSITFDRRSGNDELGLITASFGVAGNRPISTVRYRVSNDDAIDGEPGLQRATLGYAYTPTPGAGALYDPAAPLSPQSSNDFLAIGPGIFRMEVSWLLGPSAATPGELTGNPATLPDQAALVDAGKVSGLRVTLAALDEAALRPLSGADAEALRQRFASQLPDGLAPAAQWETAIRGLTAEAGVSGAVARTIRVHEIIIPIR